MPKSSHTFAKPFLVAYRQYMRADSEIVVGEGGGAGVIYLQRGSNCLFQGRSASFYRVMVNGGS